MTISTLMHSDDRITQSARGDAGLFPREHRRSIILFCAVIFFFWSALYLFVPTLPVHAQSLGASFSLVGIVIAFYGIPQFLLRIPIGIWFDSINRHKPLLVIGLLLSSIGVLGLGLAPSPWWLCAARGVTGIGAATWLTFAVYLTAYYPQGRVGRAIGLANFMQNITVLVASVLGGAMVDSWGFKTTCYVASALGLLGLGALSLTREPPISRQEENPWNSFSKVITRPLLLISSGIALLLQFAIFSSTFSFMTVFGTKIGASATDLGILTMLSVGASALISLVVINIAERWGYSFTIILGAVLAGASLVVIPTINTVFLLDIAQFVGGLGRGMLGTISMTMAIEAVAPRQRATAMGFYQAVYAIGMLSGPLLSGYLAESQGLAAVFYLSSGLCLVIVLMAFFPVWNHHIKVR